MLLLVQLHLIQQHLFKFLIGLDWVFILSDFRIEGTVFDDDTMKRINRIADMSAEAQAANAAGVSYAQLQQLQAGDVDVAMQISLDSLDHDNFKRITGRDGLRSALAGITLAQQ